MDYKPYIDLLSAALFPLIAIITAYIAYQQYRTNKIRLKHDLYERRVEVFRGVLSHLSAALRQGKITNENLIDLVKLTSEKEFLFNRDVYEYIDKIYSMSVELWSVSEQLVSSELPKGPERTELAKKRRELFEWFEKQLPEVRKKFSKYMSITR